MALPRIDVPMYELELPILKKTIKYRPFLVKEQKLLLMAAESDDSVVVEQTIRQVLQNCSLDSIDVEELSLVDLEFYFMHLRAKSVGEIVESNFVCENLVNDDICGNVMTAKLDLNEVKVTGIGEYDDTIKLTPTIGVKMGLPKYTLLQKVKDKSNMGDFIFDLIIDCIQYVYDGDQIYYAKDLEENELKTFVDNLNQEQFKLIQDFFDNIPKINKKFSVTCNKCGFEHKISMDGIESFFD